MTTAVFHIFELLDKKRAKEELVPTRPAGEY